MSKIGRGKSEHSPIKLGKVAGNACRSRPARLDPSSRAGVRIDLRAETTRLSPAETAKYLPECKAVPQEQSKGVPLISCKEITLSWPR